MPDPYGIFADDHKLLFARQSQEKATIGKFLRNDAGFSALLRKCQYVMQEQRRAPRFTLL